jgi:hypothetical protein
MHAARDLLLKADRADDLVQMLTLVAENTVFGMATRKLYVIQCNLTAATVFTTGWLLTGMITRAVQALTTLWTCKNLVHALGVTSSLTLVAAIIKASVASKLASSFWAESREVFGLEDEHLRIGVPGTAKAKSLAYRVCCTQHTNDFFPHVYVGVRFGIANDEKAMLSATK